MDCHANTVATINKVKEHGGINPYQCQHNTAFILALFFLPYLRKGSYNFNKKLYGLFNKNNFENDHDRS